MCIIKKQKASWWELRVLAGRWGAIILNKMVRTDLAEKVNIWTQTWVRWRGSHIYTCGKRFPGRTSPHTFIFHPVATQSVAIKSMKAFKHQSHYVMGDFSKKYFGNNSGILWEIRVFSVGHRNKCLFIMHWHVYSNSFFILEELSWKVIYKSSLFPNIFNFQVAHADSQENCPRKEAGC